MSILVLGGAGYIGSHTALELIRTGESVIIADNLATGHIEAVPKDAKFYLGDLHDKAFLDNIFENEQIDAVIHFAAYSLANLPSLKKLVFKHKTVDEVKAINGFSNLSSVGCDFEVEAVDGSFMF